MSGADAGARYVRALAFGLDPAWRRLDAAQRRSTADAFVKALAPGVGVVTETYSLIGLKPGIDLLVWQLAGSVDALEEESARLLRSGLGRWLAVRESFTGLISDSQYVVRPTTQEQTLFEGDRARYLIVYPFTKSTEWYLQSREARQGIMNEHIRVGHDYPTIRQALAYSFGLDSQEFVVAYETDDLVAFGDLVRALRSTESRRSTVSDTPILLGIHRSLDEILLLLGAS